MMPEKRSLSLFAALLLLSACGMTNHANNALSRKGVSVTSTERFDHCAGYGCTKKQSVPFAQEDWAPIEALFSPPSTSEQQERDRIAAAIGLFEQIVGKKAATYTDKAGTFQHMMAEGLQQDCVDESINTTVYLQLLEQKGLLRFHKPTMPMVRLPLIDSGTWPHQTATMREISTGTDFAVDSWFHDNGHPAEIVTLRAWKEGWRP